MLKTNSKAARENLRRWIIASTHTYDGDPAQTFEQARDIIRETFTAEIVEHDKTRRPRYALFVYWCSGLPSVLDTDAYYLGSAREVLGDILEETETERERYSEAQAEEMLTRLIYNEVNR